MNTTIKLYRRGFMAAIAIVFALGLALGTALPVAAQGALLSRTSKHDFNKTVKNLQRQIAAHKLAMLKKYNVQAMLKMVGVKSDKALTIAVFHPRYGKVIFENDKSAMAAAPLRMTIRKENGKVIVEYIQPSVVFAKFNVPDSFKKELDGLFESIVKNATQ